MCNFADENRLGMNKLRFLFGALAALFVMSCGQANKTNVSAVQFSEDKVLVDGKPFTGEVWSDDGVTYRIVAEKGEMVSFTLYHDNGNVAFSQASHGDSAMVCDEQGAPVSIDSFATRYKDLAKEIPELMKRIRGEQ